MFPVVRLMLVMAAAIVATPGQPQQAPHPAPSPSPDVVVEGVREVGTKALAHARNAVPSPVGFRRVATQASMFSRCVKGLGLAQVRVLVDGPVNSAEQRMALDRVIRSHAGCYPGLMIPGPPEPYFGDCNPTQAEDSDGRFGVLKTCRAFYDRGYLLMQFMHRYAPDLKLTGQDTSDPAVQARFDQVEVLRNRYREPADRQYFITAVCMVRLQPELAVRLATAGDNWDQLDRITRLILVKGRSCVGNARHVRVEPAQFQIYIADAVYRWAVAARGVASLLPATDQG